MKTFMLFVGASLLPLYAHAQTTNQAQAANAGLATDRTSEIVVGEIVVTAQKRIERLVEVPQTVNVVSGDQLEQFNITRFDDVAKLVPGLEISRGSGREQSISLRGVRHDPDSQSDLTVDAYLNEVPFELTQALQAQFDVGSIQVLRGPQGTLRGGTGPSGAILIGTRQPSLNDYEASGSASYTDRNAVNLQGGVSIPLISDKLSVRIAGLYDRNEGDGLYNIATNESERSRTYAGRATVLFQPTDTLNVMLMHQQFRNKTRDMIGVISVPDGPAGRFGLIAPEDRQSVTGRASDFVTKGRATILNAAWDFAGNRLSYVGSYQDNDFNTARDVNLGNALTPDYFGLLGLPHLVGLERQEFQRIDTNTKTWTHEARLERTGDHFWLYRFGVFFSDVKTGLNGLIDYTGANGACETAPGPLFMLPCQTLTLERPAKSRDRGYFTTQTFNFTDNDTLDLGLRYSTSRVDNPPNYLKFDAWTGSASYKHSFSEALLAYANYGRSFRPGGFDATGAEQSAGPNGIPVSFFSFGSEKSDSFEVGLKGAFFDNRVTYTVAGFYQKFDGFINRANNITCTGNPDSGVGPVPGTVYPTSDGLPPTGTNTCAANGTVNLTYQGDASVRGIEFEMRAQPLSGWSAQVNLSYADAHYDDALIPCLDYNGDGTPDRVGEPAVQAGRYVSLCPSNAALSSNPKFQATFSSDYSFLLPGDFEFYIRGLARYQSKRIDPNTKTRTSSAFKLDAFAGIRTPIGAELSLFARNLLNKRNDTVTPGEIHDAFGTATGYTTVTFDERREFGMQLRFNF